MLELRVSLKAPAFTRDIPALFNTLLNPLKPLPLLGFSYKDGN